MVFPTGTTSLVLRVRLGDDVDTSPLAQLIARFVFPRPTWRMALSKRRSDPSSLRLVQWLHDHQIPEVAFPRSFRFDEYSDYENHSAMDEAARLGLLSVVQFLHKTNANDCTKYAMDHAASHGHLAVAQFLHENRSEGCSKDAITKASLKGHLEVVRYLVEVVQTAMVVEAWQHAACGGNLDVIQYLDGIQEKMPMHLRTSGYEDASEMLLYAAMNNRLDMASWLYDHRAETCPIHTIASSATAMDEASTHGHLDFVQYLHTRSDDGCTADAMDSAAQDGHLDIVQFLHKNCLEGCTTAAMNGAAKEGHLDIVQFLHDHRTEGCTTAAMDSAAKEGHLDVVQFLHQNRTEGCSTAAIAGPAEQGYLDVVQFLHTHTTCPPASLSTAVSVASKKGHLGVIRYLHEVAQAEVVATACQYAAEHGHLEIVQYLYSTFSENDLRNSLHAWTSRVMENAVGQGHFHVVQWLHEHRDVGCHNNLFVFAARSGFLDVAQLLYENGYFDGNTAVAMDASARYGCLDVVQYLHVHSADGCTTKAMDYAAAFGHLDVVRFLDKNRSEGCTTAAMVLAARNGHLDVVRYLHDHRTEGCTAFAMRAAAENGHLDVVQFLHENRTEGCDREDGAAGISSRRTLQYLYDQDLVVRRFRDLVGAKGATLALVYDTCVATAGGTRLPTLLAALEAEVAD